MTSPRIGRTKEEVLKDFRTTEILEAARRVIGQVGYADASMDRIAQAAGIAKGTLYLYFKNKESLLLASFEHGFSLLMERTRAATQRTRGSTAKIAELVRAFMEHSSEHQVFFRGLRQRPDLGPEGVSEVADQLRKLIDEYIQLVTGFVERGIRAGEFRKVDAQRTARFLVELLHGVLAERVREGEPFRLSEDADALLDFFLHGVGAGEPR